MFLGDLIAGHLSFQSIVTWWSGPGGIEASLSGQLSSFSPLTLLVGSSDL